MKDAPLKDPQRSAVMFDSWGRQFQTHPYEEHKPQTDDQCEVPAPKAIPQH